MVRAINHRANMTRKALKIVLKKVIPSPTVRMDIKEKANVCMRMGTMPNVCPIVQVIIKRVNHHTKERDKFAAMACIPNVVKTPVEQIINTR